MKNDFNPDVTAEAHWVLREAHFPYTDEWYTVRRWLDYRNKDLHHWAKEKRDVGLSLAAFEMLVVTGHFEAGTDEFGARVFRRRDV